MNPPFDIVAALLRTALTGWEADMDSTIDWQAVYCEARRQSVVGLCNYGIQLLPESDRPEKELYYEWVGETVKIQLLNEKINGQCLLLQKRLADTGIKSSILKGQGVAALYKPELAMLRQPGDIDIMVDCGLDESIEFAHTIGQSDVKWDYKHLHLKVFKDTAIEMHYRAQVLQNLIRNIRLQHYFKRNSDRLYCGSINISDSGLLTVPEPDMNAVYMLVHMYHHVFDQGIGLKQMVDCYYVLKNVKDKSLVASDVQYLGLAKFAAGIVWMMEFLFGMERVEMPWVPDDEQGKFILENVVGSGNFGNEISGNRLRRFRRILQINIRLLKYYPVDALMSPLYYIWHFVWKRSVAVFRFVTFK